MSFLYILEVGETNLHENAETSYILHQKKMTPLEFCDLYNKSLSISTERNITSTAKNVSSIQCEEFGFYNPSYVVELHSLENDECKIIDPNNDKEHLVTYNDALPLNNMYYYKLKLGNESYYDKAEEEIMIHSVKFSLEEFVNMYNFAIQKAYKSKRCGLQARDICAIMVKLFKFTKPKETIKIRTLNGRVCQPVHINNICNDSVFQFAVEIIEKTESKNCNTCEYYYHNSDGNKGCARFHIPNFPYENICSNFTYDTYQSETYDNIDEEHNDDCCERFPYCECD